MPSELLESVLKLSVEERLQLVEEIWDSIAATHEVVPLTQAQIEELDWRKADLEGDSGAGSPRAPISSPKAGIRRAQALVRSHIPEGRRLSDELLEERRSQG